MKAFLKVSELVIYSSNLIYGVKGNVIFLFCSLSINSQMNEESEQILAGFFGERTKDIKGMKWGD